VRESHFREDPYYRLNVVNLRIPPLRQRRDDILELSHYLLRRSAARLKIPAPVLSEEAQQISPWHDSSKRILVNFPPVCG
jgi:transcriptional regulator with PAS, ATPase and Fis domain